MKDRTNRTGTKLALITLPTAVLGILLVGVPSLLAASNESLLTQAAGHLLKQDFAAAQDTLKLIDPTAAKEQEKVLLQSMNTVAGMPGILLDTFRKDAGSEVTVAFLKEKKPLRIVSVDADGRVHAEETIRIDGNAAASTQSQFTLADLSVAERVKRLGTDQSPERQIMRGLLAWEFGKREVAEKFFRDSKSPLGERLVARIFEMDADAASATVAAQKAARETAAAKAYDAILKTAEVESLRGDPAKLISAIETKRFTEAQVAAITKNLKLLQGELATADLAKTNKTVLECLALVTPNFPITVDQGTFDAALEKLAKDNPKEIIRAKFETKDGKLSLILKEYPSISNLSALSGLPLKELEVYSTGYRMTGAVTDLTPLKGMPLEKLTLAGQKNLRNLKPLVGMPLKYLNIGETAVTDLSPLRGMPLEFLGIHGCPITDLSPVKNIKNLKIER